MLTLTIVGKIADTSKDVQQIGVWHIEDAGITDLGDLTVALHELESVSHSVQIDIEHILVTIVRPLRLATITTYAAHGAISLRLAGLSYVCCGPKS